ncbi:MAG TPA: ABC transporter permease [Puia sp.]|jgi:ABC-2 type transport system permease protein|nr:ABC transporter permease [Puia sp.]
MNKTWLITRREYSTRVRNKTFLLSTFLLPLMIIVFIVGSVLIASQGHSRHKVAVMDANGYFKDYLKSDSAISFGFSGDLDTTNYVSKGYTAILIIPVLPEGQKTIYRLKYKKQLGLSSAADLEGRIDNAIMDHMIYQKTNISRAMLDSIRKSSHIAQMKSFEDQGKVAKASSQGASTAVGYISGILIYMLTFIYGAAVMRGVMEEKTNRIAEVIVSSVRPFQLMMGKITGIGAVGLTQFLLWVIFLFGLLIFAQMLIPHDVLKEVQQLQQANAMGTPTAIPASETAQKVYQATGFLNSPNWGLILVCFLFYFIGGYLFYSALFAAVGSAVNEDVQEAQSLMLPITMPVIFSFFIMTIAVQDPGGQLAIWASIIPFSSPIVMMARIPFGVPGTVPWWQLGLSMALLVAGFIFTVWMAGKIYRTGILLYGKKPTWKTMWKWAFKA